MNTALDSDDIRFAEQEEDEQDDIGYEIAYYPSDFTLKGYYDKWKSEHLVIPHFQRGYVWDQVRASKLIESFLLGLPVPGVFLYRDHATKKLHVIDGQQRIMSVIRFFDGIFGAHPFSLKKVNERWQDRKFSELTESEQIELHDSVLRATIIRQLNPEDNSSVYHIFERLNTGSVGLNAMEIRKCLNPGPLFSLLEELNKLPDWRKITGRPEPDRRLRDLELILRFVAMHERWEQYEKPMKTFLNNFLDSKQKLGQGRQQVTYERIRRTFEQTCAEVVRSLGEKPFHRTATLNPSLLDSVMVTISAARDQGVTVRRSGYDTLLNDKEFVEAAITRSTSDTVMVKKRFERARQVMLHR